MSVRVEGRRAAGLVPALGFFLALALAVVGFGACAVLLMSVQPLLGVAFATGVVLSLVTLVRGIGVTSSRAVVVLDDRSMVIHDEATLTEPLLIDAEDIKYVATVRGFLFNTRPRDRAVLGALTSTGNLQIEFTAGRELPARGIANLWLGFYAPSYAGPPRRGRRYVGIYLVVDNPEDVRKLVEEWAWANAAGSGRTAD